MAAHPGSGPRLKFAVGQIALDINSVLRTQLQLPALADDVARTMWSQGFRLP